jgi:thiol-disulfide isomerase/thioredoxin
MSKARSLTKRPTLLTAVLSLAALAGYAAYRLTLGTAEPSAESDAVAAGEHVHDAAALADSLPDVLLSDIDGAPISLASYSGRPLLINFWATWCAPCRREIPLLKSFSGENDSITVLGIAIDDLDDVQGYAEDMQFNYPILVGQAEGMNAAAALGVEVIALPFSVFAADDGAILGIHTGELQADFLELYAATIADLASGAIDRAAARERLANAF